MRAEAFVVPEGALAIGFVLAIGRRCGSPSWVTNEAQCVTCMTAHALRAVVACVSQSVLKVVVVLAPIHRPCTKAVIGA